MQKRFVFSTVVIVIALLMVATLTLGSARPVQAADIRDSGVLEAGETVDDDLIISHDIVRIDGTVNGMLIAGGQTVTLNGTINGDAVLFGENVIVSESAVIKGNLFSGARNITVNGQVDGSIAAGSASLMAGGKVGRNVYYGGYSLSTASGSDVARGLYFGGYQAVLDGKVARELNAAAGALELNGEVGGNVTLQVGSPGDSTYTYRPGDWQLPDAIPAGLRIGPNAKIGGKLVYTSEANQVGSIQAQPGGGIVYQTPVPQQHDRTYTPARKNWYDPFRFLRDFITLLLLGMLAVWKLPALTARTSAMARAKIGPSAGYGLLVVIVGYVGAVIVGALIFALGLFFTLFTLGGLSNAVFGLGFSALGLAVAAFTLVVTYISKLVVAYLVGELILSGASPTMQGRRFVAMGLGVLIYVILRSIPVIGWLFGVLVTILGVGAIWLYVRSLRKPAAETTPAV